MSTQTVILHIAHIQVAKQGTAYCGKPIKGPHIMGFENALLYEGTGPICRGCFRHLVKRVQELKEKVA